MFLNDYQARAFEFALYPKTPAIHLRASPFDPLPVYPFTGLAEETGEVLGKIKKAIRDGSDWDTFQSAMAKELGDVLWYVAAAAAEMDMTLEEIAQMNLDKLGSRRKRGVIQGSGDNR